uniref:Uncharacterized protein n=1 Tax=Arundo donax TaxID=35708 RepID=A0A0A9CR31_ARUDO
MWQLRISSVFRHIQRLKQKSQSQKNRGNLKMFRRSHILVSSGRKIRTTLMEVISGQMV